MGLFNEGRSQVQPALLGSAPNVIVDNNTGVDRMDAAYEKGRARTEQISDDLKFGARKEKIKGLMLDDKIDEYDMVRRGRDFERPLQAKLQELKRLRTEQEIEQAKSGMSPHSLLKPEVAKSMGLRIKTATMGNDGKVQYTFESANTSADPEMIKISNEAAEASRQIAGLKRGVKSGANIISDPNKNTVGPFVGSAIAAPLLRMASGFGIDWASNKLTDQASLRQLVNMRALEIAASMKGNLSNRDLQFVLSSVPQLDDNEDTWMRWFATYAQALDGAERQANAVQKAISDGRPIPAPGEFEIGIAPPDWVYSDHPERAKDGWEVEKGPITFDLFKQGSDKGLGAPTVTTDRKNYKVSTTGDVLSIWKNDPNAIFEDADTGNKFFFDRTGKAHRIATPATPATPTTVTQ